MTSLSKLLSGAILFILVAGGCSVEDGTDGASAQDVTTSTVTPDIVNERLVALLHAKDYQERPGYNYYDGELTASKDCQIIVQWYEDSDLLTVSTTEAAAFTHKAVGEPLTFEIQGKTSYRTDPSNPDPTPIAVDHPSASTISKWKQSDGAIAFTVKFDTESGPISADVSLSTGGKSGLSMKTTIGGRSLECKGLVAEKKSSGE